MIWQEVFRKMSLTGAAQTTDRELGDFFPADTGLGTARALH